MLAVNQHALWIKPDIWYIFGVILDDVYLDENNISDLFGAKPLSKQVPTYCRLDTFKQTILL